nr:hypothetical protein [Nocardia aobensis]
MRLVRHREGSAYRLAEEADGKLLPHFTVVVGENVAGICVSANDADYFDVEPGLLLRLSNTAFGQRLAEFHLPAGERPHTVVHPALKEYISGVVDDYALIWDADPPVRLVDRVRAADVDAVFIPTPEHLDPLTINNVMHLADIEIVTPRLSFARWSAVGGVR